MEIMTAVIIGVATTILVSVGTLLVRTMVRGLKTYLDDEIRSKLVPNGGSSLADRLTKLEKSVVDMKDKLEGGCPNPGCPERMYCAHMQRPPRRTLREWLG